MSGIGSPSPSAQQSPEHGFDVMDNGDVSSAHPLSEPDTTSPTPRQLERIIVKGATGIQRVFHWIAWLFLISNSGYVVWSAITWNGVSVLRGLGGLLIAAIFLAFTWDPES